MRLAASLLNTLNMDEQMIEGQVVDEVVVPVADEPVVEPAMEQPGDVVPADLDHDAELVSEEAPADLEVDVADGIGTDGGLV